MSTQHMLLALMAFVALLILAAVSDTHAAEVIMDPYGDAYYGSSGLAPGACFDPTGPMPAFLDRPLTPAERARFRRGTLPVPAMRPWTFGPSIWTPATQLPLDDQSRTGVSLFQFYGAPVPGAGSQMRANGFGIGPARFRRYIAPRGGYY